MKLPFLETIEQQADRMREMMQRLDVDVVELAREHRGAELSHARMTCLGCKTTDTCQHWLDGEETGRSPGDFCPNAALFEAHATKRE